MKPAPFSYRTRPVPDTAARLARRPRPAIFMDYRMLAAARMAPIDVLIAQDSLAAGHPLRVRGVGGFSAAGAVLARAVRDARGLAGRVGRLPLTLARVQELATNGGGR